jgi:hypothetical protein
MKDATRRAADVPVAASEERQMPRKKGAGKRGVNKSQFVRDQPATMRARDVVEKGKAQGIALSEKYVYNIRAKAKARGGAPRRKPGRPAGSGRASGGGGGEARFVDLALDLGLSKAEALLARLRSAIRSAALG